MMVTASPADEPAGGGGHGGVETESKITPLLATLDSKGVVIVDRVDAYLTLTERLRGDDQQNLAQEISQHTSHLTRLFCVDIMNENSELSQAALQALGFCVYHQDISRSISEEDANTIIKALCNALLKTEDKSTSTRALWCLSKQNCSPKTIKAELHSILCAVDHALVKSQFQSMTVEHESVNVIIKLLEQVPDDMPSYASRWAKLIYPLLVHSAHKIRDRAAFAMQLGLPALQAHRAEIIPSLIPDLKAALVPEMVKLFAGRQELHVLRIWGYFVSILGKSLHKGGSLINCLLGVVEQGFKHPSAQVKKATFGVWNMLIDNFATDPDILYNAKRLKVLMQPLKATSAKTESVAHAKLDTWWHLCQRLGPRLASNFDLVCVPLLEASLGVQSKPDALFCPTTPSGANNWPNKQLFGTPKTPQHRNGPISMGSPATPRLNLTPGTPGSKNPIFKSVQSRGVEMLVRLLGQPADIEDDPSLKPCNIATASLEHSLISSPTVFIKMARVFMTVIKEVIVLGCQQNMGDNTSEDMLLRIWFSLVAHVKNMVEVASKRDSVDIFNDFMRCVECLVGMWPAVNAKMILKLLEMVGRHIPLKILGSPSYHSSCAGAMHGTAALNFIRMMFGPHKMDAMHEERFFIVYEKFIEAGMSTPNTILGFAQSVVKMIEDDEMLNAGGSEIGWRLWNRLANPLLEHVIQSNEVNQGDSLDHDFSAMYACLLYPPVRLLNNNVPEGTLKTLMKTWSELYQAFIRCAALVTTTESNECCEELASKILEAVEKQSRNVDGTPVKKHAHWLESGLHMCQVMVDAVDFSNFANHHGNEQLTPSKWSKKKVRPLGNLHSLILLLVDYMNDINRTLMKRDAELKTFHLAFKRNAKQFHMTSAMNYAIGVISHLYNHVSQPGIIASMLAKIAQPLATFYKRLANRVGTQTHIYSETTQQKLEKLWVDILTSIQTRYGGPYDTHFLATMTPLLEITFLHPRRSVKDHTLVFWNATFATTAGSLEYQTSLKKVFSQLKEKTPIILPGWSQSDNVDMVNETPMSQLIESEASQSIMGPPSVVIPNFGSPSPVKMHGSFLKRSVQAGRLVASSSPDRNRGRSPARSPGRFASPERGRSKSPSHKTPKRDQSPAVAAVRRKLPVDEDSMQFVTIAPSPTKKRVWTEHQKEVMRQKRTVIPGLYNDLEQSQDTQAFSEMFSQTQTQMEPDPEASNEHESPIDQIVANHQDTTPKKPDTTTGNSTKAPSESSNTPTKPSEAEAESPKSSASMVTHDAAPVDNTNSPTAHNVFSSQGFSNSEPTGIVKIWTKQDLRKSANSPVPKAAVSSKLKASSSSKDTTGGSDGTSEVKVSSPVKDIAGGDDNSIKIVDEEDSEIQEVPVTTDGDHNDSKKEAENEPKENPEIAPEVEECTQKDDKQEVEIVDETSDQVTPTKNSSAGVDNQVASQETTPPRTSQSPSKNVMVTPVIKLQKMSVKDILKFSPRAIDSSAFAKLDVDSSPKMFPSSKEKDEQKRRSRFRRYKSEEIRSSPRPKSEGRPASFDDMVILETQSEEIQPPKSLKSLAGKQEGLLTTESDLAGLAETFELDGIKPLADDQTENAVDKPAKIDDKLSSNISLSEKDVSAVDQEQSSQTKDSKPELQRDSSEESMEYLDSQEDLIPAASQDQAPKEDSASAMETDSQSDYFTPDESESEDKLSETRTRSKRVPKSKERPDFLLPTLEEATEPESLGTISKPNSDTMANDGDVTLQDNKELDSQGDSQESEADSSQLSSASMEGTKRGRGRPRKVKSPDEKQEPEKPKRGIGRPRKTPKEEGARKNKSMPKRSRSGRFRKESDQIEESTGDESESLSEGSQDEKLDENSSKMESQDVDTKSDNKTTRSQDIETLEKEQNQVSSENDQNQDCIKTKLVDNECIKTKLVDNEFNETAKDGSNAEAAKDKEKHTDVQEVANESQEKDSPETEESQADGTHLENSCEDMFGTYNPDVPSGNASDESPKEETDNIAEAPSSSSRRTTRSTASSSQEEAVVTSQDDNENDSSVSDEKRATRNSKSKPTNLKKVPEVSSNKEEEDSVTVVAVKPSPSKKKRRSFTKLSRKRHRSPNISWDEDDDVPLAKITHSYLDVESQSSDESDNELLKKKTETSVATTRSKSSEKESVSDGNQKSEKVAKKKSKVESKKQFKRKSPRYSSIKKNPQSIMAKKALQRALKSPPKKSPKILSPIRKRSSTPPEQKGRSPIATRMRAGKLTPVSARRLLAGHGRGSPKKKVKEDVKEESEDDDELNISGVEEQQDDGSFDESFDLPLNQYIKQSQSPDEKDKKAEPVKEVNDDTQETTTQETKTDSIDKLNTKEQTSVTAAPSVMEAINSSKSPMESVVKEVQLSDPKVGQSLQSVPQRFQFAALSGRDSPTECNTPPQNTSPVVPHKFSPRSSSSPVEFAMRRGVGQGSPRQRESPVGCEIPGVFSPSASPSNGILKRRDSHSPSPSPSTKSRRVSFAEPVEQEKAEPSSPQAKPLPITHVQPSSPGHGGTIIAAMMPSPLVTTTSSRVVSLQSKVSDLSPGHGGTIIAAMMPSPLVTTTSSRVVSLQSKFITTPSRRANSTSKVKSVTSAERMKQRQAKKQTLKVMNTRMLFSRGARALMASKKGVAEISGKTVSTQEQYEIAALDSMTRSKSVFDMESRTISTPSPKPTPSTQGTQGPLTQGTQNTEVDSSMDVDFESQEAVFPDLVDCNEPVDKVLPQLTSSMWVRGLEQLIRARNILTVGHLCSLSPSQVKSLPIRSPKVSTLCKVMEKFKNLQLVKLEKENASTVLKKVNPPQKTISEDSKYNAQLSENTKDNTNAQVDATSEIPSKEDQLEEDSSKASSSQEESKSNESSTDESSATAVPEATATKEAVTEYIQGVISGSQPFTVSTENPSAFRIISPRSKPPMAGSSGAFRIVSPKARPPVPRHATKDQKEENVSGSALGKTDTSTNNDNNNTRNLRRSKRKRNDEDDEDQESSGASSSVRSSPKRQRMVEQLGDIAKELSGETLNNLSTDKLFQAHQHVNNLMESIMAALKTKCRSPSLDS